MANISIDENILKQLMGAFLAQQQQGTNINQAVQDKGAADDLQARRTLDFLKGGPRRLDISGNVIDQVNPKPTGLGAFYANNPSVRPGEFDPTGDLAQGRRNQEFRLDDTRTANTQKRADLEGSLLDFLQGQLAGSGEQSTQVPEQAGPPIEAFLQQTQDENQRLLQDLDNALLLGGGVPPETPREPTVFGPAPDTRLNNQPSGSGFGNVSFPQIGDVPDPNAVAFQQAHNAENARRREDPLNLGFRTVPTQSRGLLSPLEAVFSNALQTPTLGGSAAMDFMNKFFGTNFNVPVPTLKKPRL